MLIDTLIERSPGTVNTGADINPTAASMEPILEASGLRLFTRGNADSAALYKITRPLYSPTPYLEHSLTLTLDDTSRRYLQSFEFDFRIIGPDGLVYAFDMQMVNRNGMFMLQTASGVAAAAAGTGQIAWNDTGIQSPMPKPGVPFPISAQCSYDLTAKTCSILAAALGDVYGNVPENLLNQPAAALGWTPINTVVHQQQRCLLMDGETSDLINGLQTKYQGS